MQKLPLENSSLNFYISFVGSFTFNALLEIVRGIIGDGGAQRKAFALKLRE
jgi:hypothetical protein